MRIDSADYPKIMGLSKIVLNEFPFGHVQTMTYGDKRIGKTIYILLSMMDQYKIIYPDMSLDDRFKKALHNTVYTIEEFIDRVKTLQKKYDRFKGADTPKETTKLMIEAGVPEPDIQVDDAGVGFNKYKYFSNRGEVEELKSIMDTVGIVVTGLHLTSPTIGGVLGFLQEYEGYRIHIIKRSNDFRRIAKIYKLKELPSARMRVSSPKNDPYNSWLPSDLYQVYRKKRSKYLKMGIENLETYRKNLKERKQRDPDLEKTIAIVKEALKQSEVNGLIV